MQLTQRMHFYLRSIALLTISLPVIGWAQDLRVSVEPLEIDLSEQGANYADLQLIYAKPGDNPKKPRIQTPFHLYLVGTDSRDQRARALALYEFDKTGWQKKLATPMDSAVNLSQLIDADPAPRLVTHAEGTLEVLDVEAQSFKPLIKLPSIYRTKAVDLDTDIEFARDLTGDGLDDLLMPDFDGWRFSVAQSDGTFSKPQLFGPQPIMNVGSARYVNFTANTPYLLDHNQDDRLDVAFWADDALQVYYQNEGAVFSTTPVTMEVAPNIESDAFFSLSVGTDEDNPTGRQVLLDAIEDLDGDGLPDMVVYSVTGEGLFGKETRFEIHRGVRNEQNQLTFESTASSVVGSGGIQIAAERRDLNGDGTLEMMVTSFDLGIGSIIRGLLSRKANLQLAIYEMQDGRYPKTPVLTRKVTAKLDIGKGDIFVPAVLAGDVNGDGIKDLLVQDGDGELDVFVGQTGKRLFARSPITINVDLPESDGSIKVANLDGDADDDLLVLFDANKAEQRQPQIHAVRFSPGEES